MNVVAMHFSVLVDGETNADEKRVSEEIIVVSNNTAYRDAETMIIKWGYIGRHAMHRYERKNYELLFRQMAQSCLPGTVRCPVVRG